MSCFLDLLPQRYVTELMNGSQKIPVSRHRVVMLQLDVCNFTSTAATMSALQLATTIHRLFSEFDQSVIGKDLFKKDTMGDAYIIVGWLPDLQTDDGVEWLTAGMGGESDEQMRARKAEEQTVCGHMLDAAAGMLATLAVFSDAHGQAVEARVGITLGRVLAGIHTSRQPRFNVLGPALKEVQLLESTCPVGSLHVSEEFLKILDLVPAQTYPATGPSQVCPLPGTARAAECQVQMESLGSKLCFEARDRVSQWSISLNTNSGAEAGAPGAGTGEGEGGGGGGREGGALKKTYVMQNFEADAVVRQRRQILGLAPRQSVQNY